MNIRQLVVILLIQVFYSLYNFKILGEKMLETQYLAAKTIDEAVNAHSKANGSARFLAGGTDLLVQIKSGIKKKNKY